MIDMKGAFNELFKSAISNNESETSSKLELKFSFGKARDIGSEGEMITLNENFISIETQINGETVGYPLNMVYTYDSVSNTVRVRISTPLPFSFLSLAKWVDAEKTDTLSDKKKVILKVPFEDIDEFTDTLYTAAT